MTINHEVKGSLARLLATENLIVEHKKVSTASFDVVNRVLVLPLWEKASSTVYDMLVGHEVGHALYTPDQWDFLGEIPKDYVNVIEDARIEKLMKRKYPGLSKCFYKGYNELNDEDFFSIKEANLNKLSLIDRINLHFKVGAYARIPFQEEELKFIELTEKTETFDDVLNVCRLLMEYIKTRKQDTASTLATGTPQEGSGDSSGESGESVDSQQVSGESSLSDGDSDGDAFEDSSDARGGSAASSDEGGGPDEEISETQRSFDQELKELNQYSYGSELNYIEVPNIHIDRVIVDYKSLNNYIEKYWHEDEFMSSKNYNLFESSDNAFKAYKTAVQKEVNYLVKEFECKKSADAYARSSTARTGVLDCTKLHTYKYNEDIFRKVSVIPDGKNHGLIFILDWSGSMTDYLLDTVKQLLNLVWFCKKVQIPFEVYGFTYDFNPKLIHTELTEIPDKYDRKSGSICIHKFFHLLNFVSSKVSSKDFEKNVLNLWRLAYAADRYSYSGYSLPAGLDLSGTPLNESIMCLHKIIPQFKNQNKLQKVNVVILTDGDANGCNYDVKLDIPGYHGDYNGIGRCSINAALRDRKTGHVYRPSTYDSLMNNLTTILLENVKHNFPEVNLIGFRILSGYEFNTFTNRNFDWKEKAKFSEKWKKDKSVEIKNVGYDSLYAISSIGLSSNVNFDVEEEASNAQIGKAFRKMLKSKGTNKKILSSFASLVA